MTRHSESSNRRKLRGTGLESDSDEDADNEADTNDMDAADLSEHGE